MSARRGSLTLTRLFVRGEPPKDLRKKYLAAVRARVFEPLKPEDEAVEGSGWCVLDRPFDLELDTASVFEDRFLLLGFRVDRFRIPASMIRASMADEEQRLLAKTGKNRLSRNERLEIKDRVVLRLRKKIPPSTRCLDVVWDLDGGVVLFFSHSRRTLADFTALFEKTFGLELDEDSPYLAAERAELPARLARAFADVQPLAFSDARKALAAAATPKNDVAVTRSAKPADTKTEIDEEAEEDAEPEDDAEPDDALSERVETTRFLGPEFLLWVWLRGEFTTQGIALGEDALYHVWLDRQVVFESPLDKNERVTIRGAAPTDGNEAREALGAQKFPVRARIVLESGDREFILGLDAPRFAIAGAALPAVLSEETSEAFLERMALAEALFTALDRLYAAFLADRLGDAWKSAWQPAVLAWVRGESVPAEVLQLLQPKAKGRSRSRALKA